MNLRCRVPFLLCAIHRRTPAADNSTPGPDRFLSRPLADRRKYFTVQKSPTQGEKRFSRANEKWSTWQCALNVTNRTRLRNVAPTTSYGIPQILQTCTAALLTVDDGKLEKYRIEFALGSRIFSELIEFLFRYLFRNDRLIFMMFV